jgi:hypothetical protein
MPACDTRGITTVGSERKFTQPVHQPAGASTSQCINLCATGSAWGRLRLVAEQEGASGPVSQW